MHWSKALNIKTKIIGLGKFRRWSSLNGDNESFIGYTALRVKVTLVHLMVWCGGFIFSPFHTSCFTPHKSFERCCNEESFLQMSQRALFNKKPRARRRLESVQDFSREPDRMFSGVRNLELLLVTKDKWWKIEMIISNKCGREKQIFWAVVRGFSWFNGKCDYGHAPTMWG